jgi:CheY-like chemotaxis protein
MFQVQYEYPNANYLYHKLFSSCSCHNLSYTLDNHHPMSSYDALSRTSVKEFRTVAELQAVLAEGFRCSQSETDPLSTAPQAPWTLAKEHFDPTTMKMNTLEEETKRLLVLKSLLALDETNDESLDRLTGMASRMFDVPICLVSLVDFGRIWFVSNTGLGELRSTDRLESLCEYAIQNKGDMLVIPDTTKCPQHKNHPVVTGNLGIRFYASASLLVDGCSVANLCLIGQTPRQSGLSLKEQDMLRDIAALAAKTLVDRRFRLQSQSKQERLVSATSHDLMTPLMGLSLSLSVLKDDPYMEQKLDANHLEMLRTASTCGDLVSRICKDALDGMRQGITSEASALTKDKEGQQRSETFLPSTSSTTLDLSELVSRLDLILRPVRANVPLMLTIDDSAPESIVCDDLKVTRAALCMLTSASRRTNSGFVRMRVFCDDAMHLTFECQDTAPSLDSDAAIDALQAKDAHSIPDASLMFLHMLSSLASDLGGTAGFQPTTATAQGSIIWFTIPIVELTWPSRDPVPSSRPQKQRKIDRGSVMLLAKPAIESELTTDIAPQVSSSTCETFFSIGKLVTEAGVRQKLALVVDDSIVIRKTLGRALSKLGYEVVMAEDGLQGLEELKKKVFDLTFMDFLMPNLDGLDCISQYRIWEQANRPWVTLHIIGISGHASANDVAKGTDIGMNDFRAKPITLKCLSEITGSDVMQQVTQRLDALVLGGGMAGNRIKGAIRMPQKSFPTPILPADSNLGVVTNRQCLVVAPQNEVTASARHLEQNGWKTCTAVNSQDALELLKSRNWGAVLVDDKILPSATACIDSFRQWESETRVNSQKNIFMLSSCDFGCLGPSDRRSLIPPSGFQGVLNMPVPWDTFEHLVGQDHRHQQLECTERDFIMR